MATQSRAEFHADHRHWMSDIRTWREDIDEWEKEQHQTLMDVEAAVSRHVAAIRAEADSLAAHEEEIASHEHLLADWEGTETLDSEVEPRLAMDHQQATGRHEHLRQAHERMKRHHHRATARLMMVLRMLEEPEERGLALPVSEALNSSGPRESGEPGGGRGRVDVTGVLPAEVRIDSELTEGHVGYEESGDSELRMPRTH
jgi:hypothetical protein